VSLRLPPYLFTVTIGQKLHPTV